MWCQLDSITDTHKYVNLLSNPFQIEILSNFINQNKKLPNNLLEIWESYISNRLRMDKSSKLAKKELDVPLIKSNSKKMALLCELMNTSYIKEDDLYVLIGSTNYNSYIESPLIEKDIILNSWAFEHKNIQEFFVAELLQKLEFKELKK